MPQNIDTIAFIVVAAGRGSRSGLTIPKQYHSLCGQTLFRRTLNAIGKIGEHLSGQSSIKSSVICVTHKDDDHYFNAAIHDIEMPCHQVYGGTTRQESVYNGLQKAKELGTAIVLIHDAARPFVTYQIVERLLAGLKEFKAVIPAVKTVDTLKLIDGNKICETIDRNKIISVQTPQAFMTDALLQAHEKAKADDIQDLTDDGAVMEYAGHSVGWSDGDSGNYKLTTPQDFIKAEQDIMMQLGDIRVGQGYDVHGFAEGDYVTLCGVDIPHDKKLKGHSDADVAMHALTDALLSAIADGDIGSHFPPSDPQWKGASSEIFLKHACNLIENKGGVVANITILIICEAPKIGPHRQAMRLVLSKIMGLDVDRISVQATTTEKLGFTGRREGIAAQASATVRLPFINSDNCL